VIIYLPSLDLLLGSQSLCPSLYCALCAVDASCEDHDHKAFEELRLKVVIPETANAIGWRVSPRTKVEPRPEENEVISFAHFHSFGFGVLAHPLLRWLLYYYGLRLHDLTPHGILHLSIFIMLCEGFPGVPAYYDLWQSLF
jgi:hypothetical protein